jgi:hypothetical protein
VKLAPGASPEMTAATVHELPLGQHGVAVAACARDGKGAAPSSSCAVIVAFTSAGGSWSLT